jgi:hypothetical protein
MTPEVTMILSPIPYFNAPPLDGFSKDKKSRAYAQDEHVELWMTCVTIADSTEGLVSTFTLTNAHS